MPPFETATEVINCHHNYVAREKHYGENVLITRKGAVRAREGDMGIIPGSMERARTSFEARVIPKASTAAVMAPARHVAPSRRSGVSPSKITSG